LKPEQRRNGAMIRKVLVLGGGSAGFLAALALKVKLPQLAVALVHSKELGIIGVGEGSTVGLTDFLHKYLGISLRKFFATAQPTWKLGLRFLWGPRPHFHYAFSNHQLLGKVDGLRKQNGFYCWGEMLDEDASSALMERDRIFERQPNGTPAIHTTLAYHFENEKFVSFLADYAHAVGVSIIDDKMVEAQRGPDGIDGLRFASGRVEKADLFVDCSGFASSLLGNSLGERFTAYDRTLFCDRAVIGGWARTTEPIKPYTTCETMRSGWCWQIEHETRINRGYVYASSFITDDAAEKEFREKNPLITETRIVKYVSGRYENFWVGNVVAIGNAAGFVEPLEATALGVIAFQSRTLTEILRDGDQEVTPFRRAQYNSLHRRHWDRIRDFLAVHYRFNTRVETPFWRHCQEHCELAGAAAPVECYQENGPSSYFEQTVFDRPDQFGLAGYFAMLIGQKVPCKTPYKPSSDEMRIWENARRQHAAMATRSMSIAQTLAAIRSPKWRWL
jgi:tryptophan halogenase